LYLITEFASGGELFDHIVQNKRLKEREACRFFQQIISGIEYVHKLGIVHRDLKPENLLLDKSKNIKIVDFGLSNLYKTNELLKTACGSPCYAAPEMIAGKKYVGLRVDIWSAGVILYAMICGYLPFDDPDTQLLYRKIMNGDYTIPNHVTPEGRDLIKRILNTDPERRYSIDQIRSHPWYKLYVPNEPQGILVGTHRIPVDDVILDQIPDYNLEKEEVRKHVTNNKHNKMTTLYYLLMLKASRNGYISPADVTNPNFMPEPLAKDEGTKRDISQERPRSRSESAAKKDIGQRLATDQQDPKMTDRRDPSNTPSRIGEKRPSIKPEVRRPTNPHVVTGGSSATGANLNNSMFNVPNPVIVKPTTDYSTKTQAAAQNRSVIGDSKSKPRSNVQRMNNSGMDDSTHVS
jgi:serine/threonine protein kinase